MNYTTLAYSFRKEALYAVEMKGNTAYFAFSQREIR